MLTNEAVFDEVSKSFDNHRKADARVVSLVESRLRSASRSVKVLDVGCGTGRYCYALAKRFPEAEFVGVDASRGMIRLAESKCPRAWFINGDIFEVGLPSKSFDAVLAFFVIHLLDWKRFLGLAKEVLAPGGTLFLITSDRTNRGGIFHDHMPLLKKRDAARFPLMQELFSELMRLDFSVECTELPVPCVIKTKSDIRRLASEAKDRAFSYFFLISDATLKNGLKEMEASLARKIKTGPISRDEITYFIVARLKNPD